MYWCIALPEVQILQCQLQILWLMMWLLTVFVSVRVVAVVVVLGHAVGDHVEQPRLYPWAKGFAQYASACSSVGNALAREKRFIGDRP